MRSQRLVRLIPPSKPCRSAAGLRPGMAILRAHRGRTLGAHVTTLSNIIVCKLYRLVYLYSQRALRSPAHCTGVAHYGWPGHRRGHQHDAKHKATAAQGQQRRHNDNDGAAELIVVDAARAVSTREERMRRRRTTTTTKKNPMKAAMRAPPEAMSQKTKRTAMTATRRKAHPRRR